MSSFHACPTCLSLVDNYREARDLVLTHGVSQVAAFRGICGPCAETLIAKLVEVFEGAYVEPVTGDELREAIEIVRAKRELAAMGPVARARFETADTMPANDNAERDE